MLRELTASDQQLILDYAYQHELENMFVIGSFEFSDNPFEFNTYLGYFEKDVLTGLGVYFGHWNDITLHAESTTVIDAFVDEFVKQNRPLKYVVAFQRHALPTLDRLQQHGITPIKVREQTLYLLEQESFHDCSTGAEVQGTSGDIDGIIRLGNIMDEQPPDREVPENERARIVPEYEWLLKQAGEIIAKANVHGLSRHYAQVGGVMTHPAHQGKGYAKQTVSATCRHWFARDRQLTLFVNNDNTPAIRAYTRLGFQPIGEYIHAEFA
ncbi:GNAT family N-acetyltransferase [Gimesia chilikensis]|uniref:GNAT family N-acetyltransferase n=1 Tax=Gimesia chilikensis TaxID=2605989 RepID=UPI003A8E649D